MGLEGSHRFAGHVHRSLFRVAGVVRMDSSWVGLNIRYSLSSSKYLLLHPRTEHDTAWRRLRSLRSPPAA